MKYIANPVEVDAKKILSVRKLDNGGNQATYELILASEQPNEECGMLIGTPEMCSRMTPTVGDYVITQSDGYIYLNPAQVFERKYSPKP